MSSESETLLLEEPEIVDAPMSAEELDDLRRTRRDPKYLPAQQVNPIHESFGNRQLRLLGPFLGLEHPPLSEELETLLERHPVRQARPGRALYATMLELLARYCFLCGRDWDGVAMEAAKLLRKRDASSEGERIGAAPGSLALGG